MDFTGLGNEINFVLLFKLVNTLYIQDKIKKIEN